ncbi:hypothetical protein GCK32_000920 [Trichostrongylus colubriformis]|uniref:Uncharacterized protein n=1 Tax=Trichostrongylus colubriformis TaxID=6319 RepID=A0AAN8F1D3_TRICO
MFQKRQCRRWNEWVPKLDSRKGDLQRFHVVYVQAAPDNLHRVASVQLKLTRTDASIRLYESDMVKRRAQTVRIAKTTSSWLDGGRYWLFWRFFSRPKLRRWNRQKCSLRTRTRERLMNVSEAQRTQ